MSDQLPTTMKVAIDNKLEPLHETITTALTQMWRSGYFSAVAALIRRTGLTTEARELFHAVPDFQAADVDDLALFQEMGLVSKKPSVTVVAMMIHDVMISEDVVTTCVKHMQALPFTAESVTLTAIACGVPEMLRGHYVANRVADRLIQRHRKAGNIKLIKFRTWKWVGRKGQKQ